MLQRYIGNKNALIRPILDLTRQLVSPGSLVCDAFAGSAAVSVAFKAEGYRVATNDINLLSWIYSTAYLQNSGLPLVDITLLAGGKSRRTTLDHSEAADMWRCLLDQLVAPKTKLLPSAAWRSDFHDHYCEDGSRSAFESSRGRSGRRRFFSAENAKAIDRALSRIRWWYRSGSIDENIRCLLTACLMDGIEKVSNTQGTYHDFPREFYDSRALRPLRIELPGLSLLRGRTDHIVGRAEDSLDFVPRVPEHSVLYLDPPYNFRQYTSYYFLPNIVSRYPEIDCLDEYFAGIEFVRGQNMEDDFNSTFCKAAAFIPSLSEMVRRARCQHVIMSYFDGKNHWSDFKGSADGEGRAKLEEFFSGELFEPGSMKCYPVDRLNYQSYGGYRAQTVKEFLFVASKRTRTARVPMGGGRIVAAARR